MSTFNNILFEDGKVIALNEIKPLNELEWNQHPKFIGVSIKNIVSGETTDHQISCHVVKINPGCEIGDHIHQNNLEIHEVIYGTGYCTVNYQTFNYEPGTMNVIPSGLNHKVIAGEEGLYLLAKFTPATV